MVLQMVITKYISCFLIGIVSLLLWPSTTTLEFRGPISDFIADHDLLNYYPVMSQHNRVKRSIEFAPAAGALSPIIIRFRALGRLFHLHLLHDDTVLSSDAVIAVNGLPRTVNNLLPVRGYVGVRGANNSFVYGVLNNGIFRGSIQPGDEEESGEYHVEPSLHYLNTTDPAQHSIIYHDRHVDWRGGALKRVRRDASPPGHCALAHAEVAREMKVKLRERREAPARQRRSANDRCNDKSALTCSLYLQSDTFLWNYFYKKVGGRNKEQVAVSEITSLFLQHVSAAKSIYMRTKFQSNSDRSISYTGVDFRVQRILINTSAECQGAKRAHNPFCADNVDVINFLNLNAFIDHSKYCLAYVFTYRDFQRGTLGLAWVGDANNAGGICERYRPIPEGGVQVHKSLNTGVVTLLNYGSTVSVRVSQSTFAHEMGHNFGATHDDDTESDTRKCVPGATSTDGNYIMFSSATGGDKKHNTMFSDCSREKIARQLDLVIRCSGKTNCLMKADGAFCGNKLVERTNKGVWEQCDCGYEGDRECNNDRCCNPTNCTLRPSIDGRRVLCSPTAGECCNSSCQFLGTDKRCDNGDECREPSYCNGTSAACPAAKTKPNFRTTCSERTRTCKDGECVGSICAYVGLEECFISYKGDDKATKAVEMCYVACSKPGGGECISTHNLLKSDKKLKYPELTQMLRNFSMETGIQMKPGAPCDNYRGYCDVFSRCRSVDADGPLTRLKNLIFSPRTLTVIREWITQHWYYVIAIALGVILFMALFVKCCAVHTPSSNPSAPRHRTISETLRRGSRRTRAAEAPGNGRQHGVRVMQRGEMVELDAVGYSRSGPSGGNSIEVLAPSHEPMAGRYTEAPPPYDQATPGHGHGRGRRHHHQLPAGQQKPQPKPRSKKKAGGKPPRT